MVAVVCPSVGAGGEGFAGDGASEGGLKARPGSMSNAGTICDAESSSRWWVVKLTPPLS